MPKVTMVPIKALQASERVTQRLLALVKYMSKVLRGAQGDGVAEALYRSEAILAGVDMSLPDETKRLRGIIEDAIHHLQSGRLTSQFVINELELGLAWPNQ